MAETGTEIQPEQLAAAIRMVLTRMTSGETSLAELGDDTVIWDPDGLDAGALQFDSLDLLELTMTLEEDFGVVLPDTFDLTVTQTIGTLASQLHVVG